MTDDNSVKYLPERVLLHVADNCSLMTGMSLSVSDGASVSDLKVGEQIMRFTSIDVIVPYQCLPFRCTSLRSGCSRRCTGGNEQAKQRYLHQYTMPEHSTWLDSQSSCSKCAECHFPQQRLDNCLQIKRLGSSSSVTAVYSSS